MSTYAVKNQNEKSQSGTKSVSKAKSDSNEFVDFFDQRPEAEGQSRVQELANKSSQSIGLSSIQQKADSNTNNSQPVQLKKYLNLKKGVSEEEPIQGKFMPSSQFIRLSSLQQKADSNSNNSQPVQLKKYLNLKKGVSEEEPIQGKFMPIQKNENKTGLPDTLKSGMESLSGVSMDDVKVHLNSKKPEALQAHAYAQGTDIHVGPGQEKHLPHEAWHVVQQKQGRVKPTVKVNGDVPVNDSQSLEQEATYMGQKALNNQTQDTKNSLNNASIQTPTAQLWPKWLGGKGDSGPKKEEEEKEGMWSKIKSGASAVGGAMSTAGGAVGGAMRTAGGAVGGAMSTAGKMVKGKVASGVQAADDFIAKAPDRARGAVGAARKTASKVGGKLGAGAGGILGAGKFLTNKVGLTTATDEEKQGFKATVSHNAGIGRKYGSNEDNVTGNLIKEKATAKKDEILDSFTTSVHEDNRVENKVSDRFNRVKDGFQGKDKPEGHRSFLNLAAGKTLGAAGGVMGGIGGSLKGAYRGFKSSSGFVNTAKGMFKGASSGGKQGAAAGYKMGDELGAAGVEHAKTGVGMAVGAATGTVGALGGAAYGGIKGLAEGYKTSGKGFMNTAKGMFSGAKKSGAEEAIKGGKAGYNLGKQGTEGLINLAEELPGAAMDLTRGTLGAATGTVGALGGAVKGGYDGYKSGKGVGSGILEGGKSGAKAGFEMGANSKAAQYVTSKGVAKAAGMAADFFIPGSGTLAKAGVNAGLGEYYKEPNKKAEPGSGSLAKAGGNAGLSEYYKESNKKAVKLDTKDVIDGGLELGTGKNLQGHITNALGLEDLLPKMG
jgi:hypothetical protein